MQAPLIKAYSKFESFRNNTTTEQEKAGIVLAYKYCFVLTCKSLNQILTEQGLQTHSPKETLQAAAIIGLIDSQEIWMHFLKLYITTFKSYEEEMTEEILASTSDFSRELGNLLKGLEVD